MPLNHSLASRLTTVLPGTILEVVELGFISRNKQVGTSVVQQFAEHPQGQRQIKEAF